jgi:hypothetical protein
VYVRPSPICMERELSINQYLKWERRRRRRRRRR